MAAELDAADCRILRLALSGHAFGWQPEALAVDGLAAGLGVHRNTVERRLRRLAGGHAFLPLQLGVAPQLLGLVGCRAWLPTRGRAGARELRSLLDIDGVFWVVEHPDGVSVTLFAEDEARMEARLRLAAALLDADGMEVDGEYPRRPLPPLRDADARVLLAALAAPGLDRAAIARQAGCSARTVQRRLAALRQRGLVRMRPTRPLAVQRPAVLYVRWPVPERDLEPAARRLAGGLPDHLFRFTSQDAVHAYLAGPSAGRLALDAQAAARRAGVEDPRCRPVVAIHPNPAARPWSRMLLERRWDASRLRGAGGSGAGP